MNQTYYSKLVKIDSIQKTMVLTEQEVRWFEEALGYLNIVNDNVIPNYHIPIGLLSEDFIEAMRLLIKDARPLREKKKDPSFEIKKKS